MYSLNSKYCLKSRTTEGLIWHWNHPYCHSLWRQSAVISYFLRRGVLLARSSLMTRHTGLISVSRTSRFIASISLESSCYTLILFHFKPRESIFYRTSVFASKVTNHTFVITNDSFLLWRQGRNPRIWRSLTDNFNITFKSLSRFQMSHVALNMLVIDHIVIRDLWFDLDEAIIPSRTVLV